MTPSQKKDIKEKLFKIFTDFTYQRGEFYTVKPSSEYLSPLHKATLKSFLTKNSIFHYETLYKTLMALDKENPPPHSVVSAYLDKCDFEKTTVRSPSSKSMTVWHVKTKK